jgi:hypothetical protein
MNKKIPLVLCLILAAAVAYASVDRDLILAVAKGRFKKVQELVEKKKANVNATYDKGKTSLHWAVISGDLKMVAYLIAKGAKLDAKDDYGDTPLHKAAFRQTDDLDIIKYLVMKGADINAVNRYGWTPLHYFSYYDNSLVVKYLIMQEAELTNLTRGKYMEITNGLTAYDIAVQKHWTNVMTSLENPDRYRQLSKTPYLSMSLSNDFGPDNMLTGPETGRLFLRVENRGGAYAPNVSVSVDAPTNLTGVKVGITDGFSLGIGTYKDLVIPVEATREAKDGLAELRIMVRESSYNKVSGPAVFKFRTQSPRPPVLSIAFRPTPPTNQLPVLYGLERLRLTWDLEDRVSNSGYADNVYFRVLAVSNCDQIKFNELSNVTLVPGEKKWVYVEIEGGENLKDGVARIRAVATDLPFKVSVTNTLLIEKKHLPRPLLTAEAFYRTSVLTNTITNARRFFDFVTNYSETTNILSNFIVTNTWTVTNVNSTNEIATVMVTNRDSGIVLKNLGEGPARNLTVGIQSILPAFGANTNELRSSVSLYNVPEIGTNMTQVFPFANFIRNDQQPFNTLNVKWSDDRKLSVAETNFKIEVK